MGTSRDRAQPLLTYPRRLAKFQGQISGATGLWLLSQVFPASNAEFACHAKFGDVSKKSGLGDCASPSILMKIKQNKTLPIQQLLNPFPVAQAITPAWPNRWR